MDTSDRNKMRAIIEQEIEKTKSAVSDYEGMTQPVSPENSIGRVSRMDAINNKSVAEAALREAQNKLKELQVMLTKVGDADFGLCARCRNPIPFKRMLLMPQSRYCVHCAR